MIFKYRHELHFLFLFLCSSSFIANAQLQFNKSNTDLGISQLSNHQINNRNHTLLNFKTLVAERPQKRKVEKEERIIRRHTYSQRSWSSSSKRCWPSLTFDIHWSKSIIPSPRKTRILSLLSVDENILIIIWKKKVNFTLFSLYLGF